VTYNKSKKWAGIILMLPALVMILLITIFPIYIIVRLSFYNVSIFDALDLSQLSPTIENYRKMVSSAFFWKTLLLSISYTIIVTGFSFLIGIGTALILNKDFRGRKIARAIMVMPWAMPTVITSMIFMWIFEAQFGIANFILGRFFSLPNIRWLFNPKTALFSVCLVTIWKNFPFFTLMLLAGLQTIPKILYEAAKVDGASALRRFRTITLPALRPVIAVSVVLSLLWAFRFFDIIYIMTGGGPARKTETLAIQIYQESFKFFNMGYASSIGIASIIITLIFVITFMRVLMKDFY